MIIKLILVAGLFLMCAFVVKILIYYYAIHVIYGNEFKIIFRIHNPSNTRVKFRKHSLPSVIETKDCKVYHEGNLLPWNINQIYFQYIDFSIFEEYVIMEPHEQLEFLIDLSHFDMLNEGIYTIHMDTRNSKGDYPADALPEVRAEIELQQKRNLWIWELSNLLNPKFHNPSKESLLTEIADLTFPVEVVYTFYKERSYRRYFNSRVIPPLNGPWHTSLLRLLYFLKEFHFRL